MARQKPSRLDIKSSVTLKDIAAHAKVSRSTVSLVLRASPLVAERTRVNVLNSIKTLGYVYNRGAATLRNSRTSTIGVVVYDISNPFFGAMVAGIESVLSGQGYVAFLANSEDSPQRQQRFLERMREHRVDAILLCPAEGTDPGLVETLAEWNLPCIQILRHVGEQPFDYAGPDFRQGVGQAMDRLVTMGHRRIAFLGGHVEHTATRERWQGYRDSLNRHDLGYQRLVRSTVTRRDGFERVQQLMAESPAPTAVVCHNDLVAFGALLGLKRMGLTPGVDCAVIGMDNVEEAAMGDPALTSVATYPHATGKEAARLALRRIANPDGAREQVVLAPQLKIRESCGTALPGLRSEPNAGTPATSGQQP